MDSSSKDKNQHHGLLGVNKAIKKETTRSPLPRIYNIRRSDFRSVVQRLTGASAALPRPRRLHQARPPPLTSPVPRPSLPTPNPPLLPTAADSPLSAYMRFLETSLLHSDGSHRPAAASPLRPPPPPPAQLDLQSPRYPPLSPGLHHPPLPLSPNIPFSPLPLQPLLPPSPGMLFPRSPSGFFASPTWKYDL